eukprot:9348526-Alexandrium_andersonii.AAC.1
MSACSINAVATRFDRFDSPLGSIGTYSVYVSSSTSLVTSAIATAQQVARNELAACPSSDRC